MPQKSEVGSWKSEPSLIFQCTCFQEMIEPIQRYNYFWGISLVLVQIFNRPVAQLPLTR